MTGLLKGLMGGLIIVFIGIMFVIGITPTIESGVATANITNSLTSMLVDMSGWIIPVLAIVGLIMAAFLFIKSKRNSG